MHMRLAVALVLACSGMLVASSRVVAQGAPLVPNAGNAGLAGSGGTALTVVLLIGVAVAVVIAARLWTTRGGGGPR
jgi:hypothetical protein